MTSNQEKEVPFLSAQVTMNKLYGIKMDRDDFIEIAFHFWSELNASSKIPKYYVMIPDSRNIVTIPEDTFVDTVTLLPETDQFSNSTYYNSAGKNLNLLITKESSNEVSVPESYVFGPLVNFTVFDNTVQITGNIEKNSKVLLSCGTFNKDKDGLPAITEKEAKSIAASVADAYLTKNGFMGMLTNQQVQIIKLVKEEAARLKQAAQIPTRLSTSDQEKVLDAISSMDRKTYGNRYL